MRLANRVAIVTGAASGIGRGIAIKLAEEGADLFLVDLNETGLAETAKKGRMLDRRVHTMRADLRDREALKNIIVTADQAFHQLDILVNNAGISRSAPYTQFPVSDLDAVLDVNLKAPFLLSQWFARYLVERRKGGRIIHITSINAELATVSGSTAYCASKGALRVLTKAQAYELGPYEITVNAVGPGHTRSGMTEPIFAANPTREKEWAQKTPLGRVGEPQDIANAVAFLASDEASYMTGQTIYVDGGRTLWT